MKITKHDLMEIKNATITYWQNSTHLRKDEFVESLKRAAFFIGKEAEGVGKFQGELCEFHDPQNPKQDDMFFAEGDRVSIGAWYLEEANDEEYELLYNSGGPHTEGVMADWFQFGVRLKRTADAWTVTEDFYIHHRFE